MKKLFYLTLFLIAALILVSCDSDDNPITPAAKGNLFVSSIPAGAQIWIDGVNSNKVTPDTVKDLDAGNYNVTLKYTDYSDTTFPVSISENQTFVVTNVQLLSIIDYFGPVRIWETVGTTATQPSGLDLSSGMAYGIGATNPDRDKVDIYYSSAGFLVQSADLSPNMSRVTYFRVGNSTNLDDGVDSPVQDASWGKSVSDDQTNYFFLYDNDQSYSKVKIQQGGGTPGNPSYVDVWWYYNRAENNTRF
jgi:hypothetical protein